MNMITQCDIYVYMDWPEDAEPVYMGVLHSETIRGKEVFSYENDPAWLTHPRFRALDPDLSAFTGKQYQPSDKSNFGLFLDSAPDRWGRTLMRRREAINARQQDRKPRTLTEADYLMGVYDGNRMGALRFKFSKEGDFMDNDRSLATPPWASIRELEHASLQIEREDNAGIPEHTRWIDMLVAPGSSLGGARPKANVVDENGHLWIVKFPSAGDTKDSGAWEMVTAEMARSCGVEMSECRAQRFGSRHHSFMTERFDRTDRSRRIHFASAMTLLGYDIARLYGRCEPYGGCQLPRTGRMDHRQLRRYGPESGTALAQDRVQYSRFELRRPSAEPRFPAYAAGVAIITRL